MKGKNWGSQVHNSYDPDGNIISYAWDFKDGSMGRGETLNHTFSSMGSYKVELTVTDNKGATQFRQ